MRNPTIVSWLSLAVAESIWWFSGLAVIGTLAGLGGSPIPYVAMLILFGLGMGSAWLFGGARGNATTMALYQGSVALVAVYMAVAAATVGEDWSFKLAWPVDMFGATYNAEGVADLIIGLVASGLVWYRAQSLVAHDGVASRLNRAFKLGTAFMAVALIVELSVDFDIGITQLLLPFFGASLIGLAASRLPQADDVGQASWPTVIGISVLAILGIGLVGGLLTSQYGRIGVRGLLNVWGFFVDAMLWVLQYPIEWMMRALFALIVWAQRIFGNPDEIPEDIGAGAPGPSNLERAEEQAERASEYTLEALRWPLSILLLIVVFFVLVFAYRRFSTRNKGDGDADRESIRGDADARADMMKLLSNLIPGWMKGGESRSLWKWPEGERGVAEVFLLYFDTLAHAIKRGMVFDPNVTPNERVSALAVFLPGAPVEIVTNRFNAACYGGEPADLGELEQLRSAVEQAAEAPTPAEEDQ